LSARYWPPSSQRCARVRAEKRLESACAKELVTLVPCLSSVQPTQGPEKAKRRPSSEPKKRLGQRRLQGTWGLSESSTEAIVDPKRRRPTRTRGIDLPSLLAQGTDV